MEYVSCDKGLHIQQNHLVNEKQYVEIDNKISTQFMNCLKIQYLGPFFLIFSLINILFSLMSSVNLVKILISYNLARNNTIWLFNINHSPFFLYWWSWCFTHPSPLCPLCSTQVYETIHLFTSTLMTTKPTVLDLWMNHRYHC